MRVLIIASALALCACGPATDAGAIPEYGCEVVHTYPHDRGAYTEGLFYFGGYLYEGTGMYGESNIRKVKLETGEVLQKQDLPDTYFGEGIIKWGDKLIELEYRSGIGFIYDFNTFNLRGQFHYPPEGWSLTTDGKRIIMDDGTPQIRFWDPESLQETGRLTVTDQGQPVERLNELEWVKGEIFANIWQTDRIARIDPVSGKVTGWIDCAGLLSPGDRIEEGAKPTDVMNGIAYDAAGDRLFVTGKRWPKLFEIKLIKETAH
jgi:glutamine cyclotransferase